MMTFTKGFGVVVTLSCFMLHIAAAVVIHRVQPINLNFTSLQSDIEALSLDSANLDIGNFTSNAINYIIPNKFNPGSFLYSSGFGIYEFTPGAPVKLLLGSDELVRPFGHNDGNSSEARFSIIADLAQYGKSKMAIADFMNNCIREYDFETDLVTTLIGVCGSSGFESRSIRVNESVNATTKFLSGPVELEFVESRNYLIVSDFAYKQIVKYDFSTKRIELLGNNLYESIANPDSLLVNPEGSLLYVSHTYGLSVVDLDTLEVTLIVGEMVYDRGMSDRPLLTGTFSQASTGVVQSLSWLVPNQIIAAVRPKETEAVVFFDLVKQELSAACVGNDLTNRTVIGNEENCHINSPITLTASNGKIYIATLAEGNPDSYKFSSPSDLFTLQTRNNFCWIKDKSQYQGLRPDVPRYYKNQTVRIRCPYGRQFRMKCVESLTNPSELIWSKPQIDCDKEFTRYLRRLSQKKFRKNRLAITN